jgi:hypothetical protein
MLGPREVSQNQPEAEEKEKRWATHAKASPAEDNCSRSLTLDDGTYSGVRLAEAEVEIGSGND